jgi:hypothetical protein
MQSSSAVAVAVVGSSDPFTCARQGEGERPVVESSALWHGFTGVVAVNRPPYTVSPTAASAAACIARPRSRSSLAALASSSAPVATSAPYSPTE